MGKYSFIDLLSIIPLSFVILLSCQRLNTNIQRTAQKKVEENLRIAESYIGTWEQDTSQTLIQTIIFFEELTLIKSKLIHSYFSIQRINREIYHKWLIWYQQNKDNVYWDEMEQKVKVKKKE